MYLAYNAHDENCEACDTPEEAREWLEDSLKGKLSQMSDEAKALSGIYKMELGIDTNVIESRRDYPRPTGYANYRTGHASCEEIYEQWPHGDDVDEVLGLDFREVN